MPHLDAAPTTALPAPRAIAPTPGRGTPRCHRCDAPPVHLWTRRPTEQEAADYVAEIRRHRRDDLQLPGELTYQVIAAIYGEPHVTVTGCAAHDLAPAPVDASPAAADAATQAGTDRRALLHDTACAGHDACACAGEPAPQGEA